MKMCRKFPVSFEEYKKKMLAKGHGVCAVEQRYYKAKFVYSCMKRPFECESWLRNWHDEDFGDLKKPEDAFEIWWDC